MKINSNLKTVFVFGAGFTKSISPQAPLLFDNWEINTFLDVNRNSIDPIGKNIINKEIAESKYELKDQKKSYNNQINMERLLTRIYYKFPFYSEYESLQLKSLYIKLLNHFSDGIAITTQNIHYNLIHYYDNLESSKKDEHSSNLLKISLQILSNKINCISFNYDTILDHALFSSVQDNNSNWHPDTGYGFYCKMLGQGITEYILGIDVLLLKLHGSLNWRKIKSNNESFDYNLINHLEYWDNSIDEILDQQSESKFVEEQLEENPVIIPPIMAKETILNQPILNIVWSNAYRLLKEAKEIFFIGYSFPETDYISMNLFQTSISKKCKIHYINHADDKDTEKIKKRKIKRIFPDNKIIYYFKGALAWIQELE